MEKQIDLSKMKILIIGASSYVGARIYSDLKNKFNVTGTYNKNKLFKELIRLDITNSKEVIEIIKKIKPEMIIHVAANPYANWCEQNQELAKDINENGTKYIVEAANLINAKIIFISSDRATVPINVYGKTKLASENYVKNTKKGFVILRPSLIIGLSPNTTNDRTFNKILKNITEKTPAIYDTSWKFQPTYLGHISEIIELIIKNNINKEIIPISAPELKTRFDIAKDILSKFNIEVISVDNKDKSPVVIGKQDKLKELGLPVYSYSEIIDKILKEIKK